MTEKIYQRPPTKEEIKEVWAKFKRAFLFSLFALLTVAVLIGAVIGAYFLLHLRTTNDFINYVSKNIGGLVTLLLFVLCMIVNLGDAEEARYYIYKRYRVGHFYKMIRHYIVVLLLQASCIVVALLYNLIIPLVVLEYLVSILLFVDLKELKIQKPPLARPLTSEENEVRKELISILVLDTANKSDAISKSGAFALLATFLDQDPEGSEQLFVEVKGQQYTGPDLLFDFLKSIDVDKLDENRFKANKERPFKLLRNADKKRELGTPLPSPQPLEPYYNYFE